MHGISFSLKVGPKSSNFGGPDSSVTTFVLHAPSSRLNEPCPRPNMSKWIDELFLKSNEQFISLQVWLKSTEYVWLAKRPSLAAEHRRPSAPEATLLNRKL